MFLATPFCPVVLILLVFMLLLYFYATLPFLRVQASQGNMP